jgi:hypothetical protein
MIYEVRRYLLQAWAPLHRHPIHQIEPEQVADRLDIIAKDSGATTAAGGFGIVRPVCLGDPARQAEGPQCHQPIGEAEGAAVA